MAKCNAIVIGVRYNQFQFQENEQDISNKFLEAERKLKILTDFLEYRIKREKNIPFSVIEYDEFSVNIKKKLTSTLER